MRQYLSSSQIIYILCISYNKFNVNRVIEQLRREYSINIEIIDFYPEFYLALNENLRPTQATINDQIIAKYTNHSLQERGYKSRRSTNLGYMNENHRVIYETEMIKAGIKIINACQNPNPVLKPLGYGWYGYGAGFTVFTQRNCPNTTPLAFWWGDPKVGYNHPFSKWYPLMQRAYYDE